MALTVVLFVANRAVLKTVNSNGLFFELIPLVFSRIDGLFVQVI